MGVSTAITVSFALFPGYPPGPFLPPAQSHPSSSPRSRLPCRSVPVSIWFSSLHCIVLLFDNLPCCYHHRRCTTRVYSSLCKPFVKRRFPRLSLLPTTISTVSPADLFLSIPSPGPDKDSPQLSISSLPFPLTAAMDSTQSKTPEFTLDSSPPNFNYDFHADSSGSPGTSGFEAFTNYGSFAGKHTHT